MTLEKRIITTERRAELTDFVGFFEKLIEEDRRQKSLKKYEILHR